MAGKKQIQVLTLHRYAQSWHARAIVNIDASDMLQSAVFHRDLELMLYHADSNVSGGLRFAAGHSIYLPSRQERRHAVAPFALLDFMVLQVIHCKKQCIH